MKVLVIGDIHGNLIALEQVIKGFRYNCDLMVCHGDVVNYGPWSNECVELLEAENCIKLLGNHEEAYIAGYYSGSNVLVKDFFDHTIKDFKHIEIIKKYKERVEIENFEIRHTINNAYYYPDTDLRDLFLVKNTVIGHSHHPFCRYLKDGKSLTNTGSVGQNRANLSVINFAVIDTSSSDVSLVYRSYNPTPLIDKMRAQKYPQDCIDYYLKKL